MSGANKPGCGQIKGSFIAYSREIYNDKLCPVTNFNPILPIKKLREKTRPKKLDYSRV